MKIDYYYINSQLINNTTELKPPSFIRFSGALRRLETKREQECETPHRNIADAITHWTRYFCDIWLRGEIIIIFFLMLMKPKPTTNSTCELFSLTTETIDVTLIVGGHDMEGDVQWIRYM